MANTAERSWLSLSEEALFEQGFAEFIEERESFQEEKKCNREHQMLCIVSSINSK